MTLARTKKSLRRGATPARSKINNLERQLKRSRQELKGSKQELKGSLKELKGSKQELKGSLKELKGSRQELKLQNRSLIGSQLELQLSRERYTDLYDAAPVSFVTFNRAGIIREANLPAAGFLGRSRVFLAGYPFINFVSKRDRRKFLSYLSLCRRNLEQTKPLSVELEIQVKVGEESLFIELISTPAEGSYPDPIVYKSIFFDITERKRNEAERIRNVAELKRARDEAELASRAKDDFLATLSHELRTPLNPVLLVASDSAKDRELPPRARANFDAIRRNIEIEAKLIDDLLDWSRITRGKMLLEKKILCGHDILRETISTVHPDIEGKQLVLRENLAAQQSAIVGDSVRLQQIFWNVLRNAVKFTPPKGTITIETKNSRREFIVTISDTGIGMTAQEIARIFGAFTQGDHARDHSAPGFGGLGIGLAISRRLMEFHSGTVEATSPGPGLGSTFVIRFPLAKPGVEIQPKKHGALAASHPKPPVPAGVRILLVEDHDATRNALAALLLRRNHKVQTAASIKEAMAVMGPDKFDLIISDIGLPDGSGNDLMRDLKEKHHLPGIALTGYGMQEDVQRSYAAGFTTHLTKPVNVESLEKALAATMNRAVV